MRKILAIFELAVRRSGFDPQIERTPSGGYRLRIFPTGMSFSWEGVVYNLLSLWKIYKSPWNGRLDDLWDPKRLNHQLDPLVIPEGYEAVTRLDTPPHKDTHIQPVANNRAMEQNRFTIRQPQKIPSIEIPEGLHVYQVVVPRLHLGKISLDLTHGDRIRYDGMNLHFQDKKYELPSFRRAISQGLVCLTTESH